jgi:hypothetical protein
MMFKGKEWDTLPQCCCTTVEARNAFSTWQETVVDQERLCRVPSVKDKCWCR